MRVIVQNIPDRPQGCSFNSTLQVGRVPGQGRGRRPGIPRDGWVLFVVVVVVPLVAIPPYWTLVVIDVRDRNLCCPWAWDISCWGFATFVARSCDIDAPGLLLCGCDAGCLICPLVPGSVSNILREVGPTHTHLVLYAVAATAFLLRREPLPELIPPLASPSVGLLAPHFGYPLLRSWNPKVHFPHFPWTDYCCFIHCRLNR